MEINKFYIDGKFVEPDGSDKIDIVNPATEEIAGYVTSGSPKDVARAVAAANEAFPKAMALTNVLFHLSPLILPDPSMDKCILKGL